jgi:hypothetical protein
MRNPRTNAGGSHAGPIWHRTRPPCLTRRISPSQYLIVLQPPKMGNSRTNDANLNAYPHHRTRVQYFPLQEPLPSQYLPVLRPALRRQPQLSSYRPFQYFPLQLQPLPRYLLVLRRRSRVPVHGLAVSSIASTPLALPTASARETTNRYPRVPYEQTSTFGAGHTHCYSPQPLHGHYRS